MNEIVKFNCDKFSIIEDDPRFITCKFYFGLIGENYNGSVLEKEDYENNKGTIGYTPICGYFRGQDFDEHSIKETPLGGLLSFADCDYKYEEYKGNFYATAKGIIAKEYLSKESENILKSNNKKISIELEVLDKERLLDGKFRFKKFIYQCITIIGEKYEPGMENAHLEVINNPREKYANFIEHTIETFSQKNNNTTVKKQPDLDMGVSPIEDKKFKKEDDLMNEQFKKATDKFGLNSNQIIEILNNALSQYKYQNGDYENEKYWVNSFDDEFIYVCDCEDGYNTKRMKYDIINNVAKVDLESIENVISAGYMPVGSAPSGNDDNEELEALKVQYAELQDTIDKKQKEMDEMTSTYASEKETMSKEIEEKQDSVIKMGKDIDTMKAELETTKAEMAKCQEEMVSKDTAIETYAKKEKEMIAEKFISQYSEKLTEDEQKDLKEKVHTFATIEEYQKEVKAFVCDKYEDEVKGKSTNASFSYLGYVPQNMNQSIKGDAWTDYIDEYKEK